MDLSEQKDEIMVLQEIYGNGEFIYSEKHSKWKLECIVQLNGSNIKFGLQDESEKGVSFSKELEHIPPITLAFELPKNYPSESMPVFCLHCTWLSPHQVNLLEEHLVRLWEENKSSVILFIWSTFLQNESLSTLGLGEEILLQHINDHPLDKRPLDWINELEEFDLAQKKEAFEASLITCNVCFEDKLGKDCISFQGCDHVYCKTCMKGYFETKVKERMGVIITCPTPDCTMKALLSQVKDLIPQDLFSDYESQVLETSLESMSDVIRCPLVHCQVLSLTFPNHTYARCSSCQFTFCIKCKKTDHGSNACKPSLKKIYLTADEKERQRLEEIYDQEMLKEAMSIDYIEETKQHCPKCWTYYEKSEGCNSMTCIKCYTIFCYRCGEDLSGTLGGFHFSNKDSKCFKQLF